jgi:hypothetical protein
MEREIILSDVKVMGNLADTFSKFEERVIECEKEGYTNEVPRIMQLLIEFGFVHIDDIKEWFDGHDGTAEDLLEIESIALMGRIFFARLNNIAQKHHNNIDMEPISQQLMDDRKFMEYFPNTIFK